MFECARKNIFHNMISRICYTVNVHGGGALRTGCVVVFFIEKTPSVKGCSFGCSPFRIYGADGIMVLIPGVGTGVDATPRATPLR